MMKKIILDCDPGHDDAFAILLASKHPDIDLLGITVVSGNQTLKKTGINTLNICQYLDIDVPVCLGSHRPIIKHEEVCEVIHGKTGLDGFDFPKCTRDFDSRRAVDFIIDTLLSSKEPITMVVTGPMTNLALAMRIEPAIINKIDQVVFMGGSIANGNVSPAAEFNIYSDPEAAYIVLDSGLKCIMIGLDVTRKVLVEKQVVESIKTYENKASKLFVDLMEVYNQNQQKVFGFSAGPLHDPMTIAYLIQPELFKIAHVYANIDISHGPSYGRTNIDIFDYRHLEKNMYVAVDVHVDGFWTLFKDVINMY